MSPDTCFKLGQGTWAIEGLLPYRGIAAIKVFQDFRGVLSEVFHQDDFGFGVSIKFGDLAAREYDDGVDLGIGEAMIQHLVANEAGAASHNDLHIDSELDRGN